MKKQLMLPRLNCSSERFACLTYQKRLTRDANAVANVVDVIFVVDDVKQLFWIEISAPYAQHASNNVLAADFWPFAIR